MLDNFREIYDRELARYEYGSSLVRLILGSTEIRAFVYDVCMGCVEDYTKEGERKEVE